MSTNEEGRLSNGSAAPPPPVTDEVTRCAIALPGAGLEVFSMPDAQAGVQQDWYTQAANRALEYAQSKASTTPVAHAITTAALIPEPVGAYATPLAQQAPFLRSGSVDYEATELPTGPAYEPAPTVDGPSGRPAPYALPSQGQTWTCNYLSAVTLAPQDRAACADAEWGPSSNPVLVIPVGMPASVRSRPFR